MSSLPAITRLADFVAHHPHHGHKPAHVDRACDAFLDTLGCIFLGHDAPVTRSALAACTPWGEGPAPIPGTRQSLPAPWAALVGGAAAHAYDLDDYTLIANDHPSAVLVPALLSQAALTPDRVSGTAILDAYLIGLEVIFRAGDAVNMGHYNRGWHTTSTLDSLGASAAVARLMGLSSDETAAALSMTTSMGSGFVSQFGTMAKPLHAGLSAKAGLLSCALARTGARASPRVLDGPVSLSTIMSPDTIKGFNSALEGLGAIWGLDRFGLGAKLYPSCGYTHRCIDGALSLRQSLGAPAPDDIVSLDLSLPDFHLAILPFGVPNSRDEALFSAPWCAAVALATGQCTSFDFTPDALARPDIRALTSRTRATPRKPKTTSINLDPDDPDTVTATLSDGRRMSVQVDLWTGAPGRDLGRTGLAEKFMENCKTVGISTEQAAELTQQILAMSASDSMTEVFGSLSEIGPVQTSVL